MAMKFRCPQCDELFSANNEMAGANVTCPMCVAEFELPRETVPRRKRPRKPDDNKTKEEKATPPRVAEGREVETEKEVVGLPVAISFRRERNTDRNELDMTPMVDVTFLLLIFFMVTAAFGLQKSYEVPAPDDTRPSTNALTLQELETDPKYIIVRIDQYDTFHVSAASWEAEQEAPSKPDLLLKLRDAKSGGAQVATHMLVLASEDATNGQVITALDAGAAIGMEDVKLMTVPSQSES